MAFCEPPGEASLDGEPPASALSQPVSVVRGAGLPQRVAPIAPLTMSVVPRGPGGASIECSSALHLPTAAFSTASRACDVASDTLRRDPVRADPAFRSNLPGETARQRLRRRLVKDNRFADARAPSLDECSLPCWSGLAFARAPRACAPSRRTLAFASRSPEGAGSSTARHRAPGFAAASRLRTPFRHTEHEAGRLDPTLPAAVARHGG
jgi:hypothetical protein